MRKPHIFTKFQSTVSPEVHITFEKNTLKEVSRVNELIQSHKIGHKEVLPFVLHLDKLGRDKINPFVVRARGALSFLDPDMKVFLFEDERLQSIEPDYARSLLRGVERMRNVEIEEHFKGLSDDDFWGVVQFLSDTGRQVLNDLESANGFYDEVLGQTESLPLIQMTHEKKYNFDVHQTPLKSLYNDCFNLTNRFTSSFSAVNPDISFQRDLVWPREKEVEFIDSLLNEIPIGVFYVNDNIHDIELGEGCGRILWDGRQRMYALHHFIMGEFPVMIGDQEVYYGNNPLFFQRIFDGTMISIYTSKFTTLNDILRAYVTINKKQITHSTQDLDKALSMLS